MSISRLQRAPSPTNSAYSGLSRFQSQSRRPMPSIPTPDSSTSLDTRKVAKLHFDEIQVFLNGDLLKGSFFVLSYPISPLKFYIFSLQKPRALEPVHARSLLDSLNSNSQSYPLMSTMNSYGESLTRLEMKVQQIISSPCSKHVFTFPLFSSVPFLPFRQDFHPKRNQARQKLATLPSPRFKDLAGDVYFELNRRYPEFKEPEVCSLRFSFSFNIFFTTLGFHLSVTRFGRSGWLFAE